MTGSPPYSLEYPDSFNRSFKKTVKAYREKERETIISAIASLMDQPFPLKSRDEPRPAKLLFPDDWTFHKLEVW